jgi:toxin-antitoxin system PIN domain toxin
VIALDTNILVYARRSETAHHTAARKLVRDLAEGDEPWAIPWPCVYEFLRVVTHPKVFDPPTDLETALADLESLLESPSLALLREGSGHMTYFQRMIGEGEAKGNLVHDAHIAALVLEHGVRELWSTDRDFARFPGVRSRNPFTDPAVHERRRRYGPSSGKRTRRKRAPTT